MITPEKLEYAIKECISSRLAGPYSKTPCSLEPYEMFVVDKKAVSLMAFFDKEFPGWRSDSVVDGRCYENSVFPQSIDICVKYAANYWPASI